MFAKEEEAIGSHIIYSLVSTHIYDYAFIGINNINTVDDSRALKEELVSK